MYIKKIQNEKIAFVCFLLIISSPYLVNLSLSMLSDSVGLFFFFLSLYFYELKAYKSTALVSSIAIFARPSYLILFLISFVFIYLYKKESLKKIFLYFFLFSLLFFTYIYIYNGDLFFIEGKRFLLGHFSLWGIGQQSEYSWFDNIFSIYNLPFLLLVFIKYDKKFLLIYLLFFFYLLWIICAQNPQNLRHLIPIVFLSSILISKIIYNKKYLILIILIFNIIIVFSFKSFISPIDKIISEIKDKNYLILSNRSIEILKNSLDNKVHDKYYKNSSIYYKKENKYIEISTDKPYSNNYKSYKGRFIGEHKYYLIINDN